MKLTEQRRPNRWFRDFWSLAKPFWISEKRASAILLLIGVLIGAVTAVYYNVLFTKNNGAFINSIANRSKSEFYQSLLEYVAIGVLWIVVGMTGHYFKYRLKLMWREWMTRRFLELWFRSQRHYFWNLTQTKATDNPDQRIAEDIKIFINTTEILTIDLFINILTLFTYGTILWGLSGVISIPLGHSNSISIPGYLLWLCIGFSMITNYTVYLVGKRLVPLEYEQQHYEADFRATLMKMRENSEVIALARGEDNEIETAMGGFDLIVKNFRAIISKFIHLEIFHEANARGKKICVSLAAAPRIFSGAMSVGDFTQALGSFQYLADCIALLSDQFQTFADWRSATRRLADFEESLSRASIVQHELQERPTLNSLDGVAAVDLELQTPDARQLIDRICLEIREGERVLFKGRSGTGKSTLFRVLAGIWPFYSGRVKQPERTQTTFLSQVPYLPQGTLRQVILYPIPKTPVSSEDIVKKLNQFGLVNLVEKLDVKEDWQKVLSPGEQQRLVLIRAIFQKPKWLFLDEATTALDQQNQTLAYQILTDELKESSIVSISHQNELAKFHQRTVDLDSVDRDTIKKIS